MAAAVVVLSTCSCVNKRSVHIDIDNVVAWPVGQVHREPDGMRSRATEPTRHVRRHDPILGTTTVRLGANGAIWKVALVVDEVHAETRRIIRHPDEAHPGAVATIGGNRDLEGLLQRAGGRGKVPLSLEVG